MEQEKFQMELNRHSISFRNLSNYVINIKFLVLELKVFHNVVYATTDND